MEYADGMAFQDCWFDSSVASDILEQRRVTALEQMAVAMIQLDKFTYNKGGQLIYCEDGKSTISGALLETDDPDLTSIYCELGPF
jgi:hypothetical protein